MNFKQHYSSVIISLFFSFILISSAIAQIDTKHLDKYFAQALSDWEVPGMAVAIVKDGEIIFAKGYGVLEEGKKKKVDEHSMFAIASNTKAFISASLAHLVWEQKISWDDQVVKHLPYFELITQYVGSSPTVRNVSISIRVAKIDSKP